MERLKGVEYLVINALRKELHMSHFNLEEALTMIARIQPKSAFLTHIGHQMGLSAEVSKELPVQIKLAYDTLEIEFMIGRFSKILTVKRKRINFFYNV